MRLRSSTSRASRLATLLRGEPGAMLGARSADPSSGIPSAARVQRSSVRAVTARGLGGGFAAERRSEGDAIGAGMREGTGPPTTPHTSLNVASKTGMSSGELQSRGRSANRTSSESPRSTSDSVRPAAILSAGLTWSPRCRRSRQNRTTCSATPTEGQPRRDGAEAARPARHVTILRPPPAPRR
jgi:hypothetical protein